MYDIKRIKSWLKVEIEHILHVREGNVHDFRPILLTPEILVDNRGFIKRDAWYAFQPELLNIEYRLSYFHRWTFSIGFFNWNNEITDIGYLHELQNLYYAIAHEELQIKGL